MHVSPLKPDGEAVLWIAQLPPTFNRSGFTGSRWKLTRDVKEWKALFWGLLAEQGVPKGLSFVHADLCLTFPQVRRRDPENYRVIPSKALGDALQTYGALEDDTAEFFRLGTLDIVVDPGVTRTEVLLAWWR